MVGARLYSCTKESPPNRSFRGWVALSVGGWLQCSTVGKGQ